MNKQILTICLVMLGITLIVGLFAVCFSGKCSTIHPEFCDNSCSVDADCYFSAKCGCLAISEKCLGDTNSDIESSSCKCVSNVCQIARFGDRDMSCNSNFDCELVYTGSKPCAPCDASIDDYICMNANKAREIREEKEQYRINKEIQCGPCPEVEYTCICKTQFCEKAKIK